MKLLSILIVSIISALNAVAEQVSPELTIQGAIEAVQKDRLNELVAQVNLVKVAAHEKHGLQPEALIEIFKNVDLKAIQFAKSDYTMGNEIIIVRMTQPLSLDFELGREPTERGKPIFTYRIVSIHP